MDSSHRNMIQEFFELNAVRTDEFLLRWQEIVINGNGFIKEEQV